MNKTRNEKKYESYLTGEMYARWMELSDKMGKKGNEAMTKEEHEEYIKLSKIRENLPKVKNLMDAQKELVELREAILDELSRVDSLDKENKDIDKKNKQIGLDRIKLESEMQTLMQEKEDIYKQLKKTDLKPEVRTKLENRLEQIGKSIDENNTKYTANEEKVEQAFKKRVSITDLSNMTKNELTNKAINLKIKMDVYNLYIVHLLKGKDLTDIKGIEAAKDWREAKKKYRRELKSEVIKFTSSKEQRDKIRKLNEITKEERNEEIGKSSDENPAKEATGDEVPAKEATGDEVLAKGVPENHETEENKLVPVPGWQEKHPRIAKFLNGLRNLLSRNKIEDKNEVNPEEKKVEAEKVEEKKVEAEKVEEKKVEAEKANDNPSRTAFLKEIRFFEETDISKIAENGVQETRQQQQHNAKVNAIEKLIANKKNARGDDGGTIAALEKKLRELNDDDAR